MADNPNELFIIHKNITRIEDIAEILETCTLTLDNLKNTNFCNGNIDNYDYGKIYKSVTTITFKLSTLLTKEINLSVSTVEKIMDKKMEDK